MSITWHNLRPWNGSQHLAFEELCCQLANYEPAPAGSNFIRKGTPDAGVECYWALPTGDDWGWQAKFFLSVPKASQWSQVSESVKTALEKHPRLASYTICLPIDRQDPRIDQQDWFMDQWDQHVAKWQVWASAKQMSVEFKYWGEHEVWDRLSREEHRGRLLFWFNRELFSQQWFKDRIIESIANAGPRYSPELNVELPVSSLFDGLGRTPAFINRLLVLAGTIRRTASRASAKNVQDVAANKYTSLKDLIDQILANLTLENPAADPLDLERLNQLSRQGDLVIWECVRALEKAAEERKKKAAPTAKKQDQGQQPYNPPEDFGYVRHHLYELSKHLREVNNFAQSNEGRLANLPALLLVGDAGTGKTHLFCDVAAQRNSSNLPTVLLLGQQFGTDEPWSQIISLLGISRTREEFLGALQALAEAVGSRALILIDALNEGDGKTIWSKHLAGMLTALSRYPKVAIGISARTSYETTVVPKGLTPHRLIREIHPGFADHEYEATRTFFDHFGIERPAVPLLVPEFQNPLFLKLFCVGLKNRGATKIPHGLHGITAVFKVFIESVNEKLSKPDYLDFDVKAEIVQKAVRALCAKMAEGVDTWLPREKAQAIVDSFFSSQGYEHSLFRNLVAEGLLAEDRFPDGKGDNWVEGIHFSYERFTDHLISKHLLDKFVDTKKPSAAFKVTERLGSLLQDEYACWRNQGVLEALSIQLPEVIGKELVDVAPRCKDWPPVMEAFIESLIWRHPKAITDATLKYINGTVIHYEDTHDKFLNALLTITAEPEHPFNAEFLHRHLKGLEMATRDEWWSIFLHHQYGTHGAVDRLIDWAWSGYDKSHIHDKAIRLCATALSWFLTSSNRFLRDRATKALVSLLAPRINVLRQIIPVFLDVNDPYVVEREIAVAYGCALRSTDDHAVGKLAEDIYRLIFKDGTPLPNILLRDYARGIIESALHRGLRPSIDAKKIRPPYKSEWPSEIPSEGSLKKYGEWRKDMPDDEWAQVRLYASVMGSEDFARYIIGTNSHRFDWSSRRLGEPKRPSRKEMTELFVGSFTVKQKRAWQTYQNLQALTDSYKRMDDLRKKEVLGDKFTEKDFEDALANSLRSLRETLGKKKLKIFEDFVIPHLRNPYQDEHWFDLSIAQRWIFQKVLDLGWTPKLFGKFDSALYRYQSYGRASHKPERIGKKYQWIAYHEFLARVSDNFEFTGDSWNKGDDKYKGPWQSHLRDIDPSCLLKETGHERWTVANSNTWWFRPPYNAWDIETSDLGWLKSTVDLPPIGPLMEVHNPDDNSSWLVLETFFLWEKPAPPGEEDITTPHRDMWYMLKSYLVKKSAREEVFDWAKRQHFAGRWMPESHEVIGVFLGEFFWAPAFQYQDTPYYNHDGWTQGRDKDIPKPILVTTDRYMLEGNVSDCSVDDTIHIYLPAKRIVDRMGLSWNGMEGSFFDQKSKRVAFDPSVRTRGPGALLINKDAFLKFLNSNGYEILWTVLGEKNIFGAVSRP